MAKYRVLMTTTASRWVEVDVPDNDPAVLDGVDPREVATDMADGYLPLCHQCAREVEVGDFEVADGDLDEVVQVVEA